MISQDEHSFDFLANTTVKRLKNFKVMKFSAVLYALIFSSKRFMILNIEDRPENVDLVWEHRYNF